MRVLVEQHGESVSRFELLYHLELGKGNSLLRGRSVESDPVSVASTIQALKLIKYDAEHRKGVQLLINPRQVITDDDNTMLHPEEPISHNFQTEERAQSMKH